MIAPETNSAPLPATAQAPSPDESPVSPTGGRPRLFTPEKQQEFCHLLRLGFSRAEAARSIGASPRTIYQYLHDDPDFAAAVQLALTSCDAQAYHAVTSAGPKSWRAAAWLIEHRARDDQRPRLSPEAILKSPRFKELLQQTVCEAIVANEITLDPGVVERKERLAELRAEIEDLRRSGEPTTRDEKSAQRLMRDIAETIRLNMRFR